MCSKVLHSMESMTLIGINISALETNSTLFV